MHVASWHETYAGILPDAMLASLSVDVRTALWRRILGESAFDGAAVHVAEDDGRVVGFGSCCTQRDDRLADLGFTGEISALYLLRSHQRRGLGRSIMTCLARTLAAQGHGAASVWVLRENRAARRFYESLGAIAVGEKQDDRPHGTLHELAYGWREVATLQSLS